MNAHRIAGNCRLSQVGLADPVSVAPERDDSGALRHHALDGTDYLEWVCAFATGALIELIQARLEEEDAFEGRGDMDANATAVLYNDRGCLSH